MPTIYIRLSHNQFMLLLSVTNSSSFVSMFSNRRQQTRSICSQAGTLLVVYEDTAEADIAASDDERSSDHFALGSKNSMYSSTIILRYTRVVVQLDSATVASY